MLEWQETAIVGKGLHDCSHRLRPVAAFWHFFRRGWSELVKKSIATAILGEFAIQNPLHQVFDRIYGQLKRRKKPSHEASPVPEPHFMFMQRPGRYHII